MIEVPNYSGSWLIPRLGIPRLQPGNECGVIRGRSRYYGSLRLLPEGLHWREDIAERSVKYDGCYTCGQPGRAHNGTVQKK